MTDNTLETPADYLQAIADQIEQHPGLYNQWAYASPAAEECGTAYCIAGWAAHLRGWEPDTPAEGDWEWRYPERAVSGGWITDDVAAIAAELLGLDEDDAALLFAEWWKPRLGLTVPGALRAIANGEPVEAVTYANPYGED
jgi:hypothetical protein